MFVHDMGVHAVSMVASRGALDPLQLDLEGYEPPCRCWELELASSARAASVLTTEPSVWPLHMLLGCDPPPPYIESHEVTQLKYLKQWQTHSTQFLPFS